MKKVLLFTYLLLTSLWGNAQCEQIDASTESAKLVKQAGYDFVKSYKLHRKTQDFVEFSAILEKETQYTLAIISQDGGATGIIGTIYNTNRNQVATSKDPHAHGDAVYKNRVDFYSEKTGKYYIKFSFDRAKSGCGSATLGMFKGTGKPEPKPEKPVSKKANKPK